ncbi:MAG: hypothetical protein JWP59_3934 [Massilia sp.]|nr:hypothetical protein [Massilia sp.]
MGTGTAQSVTYANSYAVARVPVPGYVPRLMTAQGFPRGKARHAKP